MLWSWVNYVPPLILCSFLTVVLPSSLASVVFPFNTNNHRELSPLKPSLTRQHIRAQFSFGDGALVWFFPSFLQNILFVLMCTHTNLQLFFFQSFLKALGERWLSSFGLSTAPSIRLDGPQPPISASPHLHNSSCALKSV